MKVVQMRIVLPIILALSIRKVHQAPTHSLSEGTDNPPKRSKVDIGPRCILRFSEIKLGWNVAADPFIELRTNCQRRNGPIPKNALKDYMLIIVQGNPAELALVVDFRNFAFDGSSPFVVIGSPGGTNVEISTATDHMQSIFSTTDSQRMLPVPGENAYVAFILGELTKTEAKLFQLNYNFEGGLGPRILETKLLQIIQATAVDMLILGDTDLSNLDQYKSFWPAEGIPKISDCWKGINAIDLHQSVNMCKENYDGFDGDAFIVSRESPGQENICTLEEVRPTTEGEDDGTPRDYSRKLLHKISGEELANLRNYHFDQNWVRRCEGKFPKRSKLLNDENIQRWIAFEDEEEECRFTCKTCKTYLGLGFRQDQKNKPYIITKGYLSSDVYYNSNAVKDHNSYPLHLESTDFFNKMTQVNTMEEANAVLEEFEDREIVFLNATMNLVVLVYAEVKAGLPFKGHGTIMKAMRRTGSNFGTIQHSSEAAHSITKIISTSFHMQLVQHLVTLDHPFAIMVDSSTSYSTPFLSVYIQVLEDNYPTTHFYALIPMEQGEKAKEMTDSFIEQIRHDDKIVAGFENYIITKLVAFSADGASVMVGNKKSFRTFLSTYVGRNVPFITCLAHKLDSAYKYGIKADEKTLEDLDETDPDDSIKIDQYNYFEKFEKTSNDLYTFYISRGYKRWQHFCDTAEDLGIDTNKYTKVHDIRWSASHYITLQTVHNNYYVAVHDSDRIRYNDEFEEAVQDKAEKYYEMMTDKTYVVVLHEFLDVLSTFKDASKQFQVSSTTAVGKIDIVYQVLNSLESNRDQLGHWVKDFLQNIACPDLCDEGDCDLASFEICSEIKMNYVTLEEKIPVIIPYSDIRIDLYNNLIKSVKKYFNTMLLEAFETFNPQRINFQVPENGFAESTIEDLYVNSPSLTKYHEHEGFKERLEFVSKFYNFEGTDIDDINYGWLELLKCLIPTVQSVGNHEDSTRFWPLALSVCPENWSPLIKKLVGFVLVTPYTSSEVERGFSIMNMVKTKGRSRMDEETLNAIMRIKINGPDVDEFNIYKYTLEVMKHMARSDDDTMKGGRKAAVEKLPSWFDKSRIYQ